MMMNHACSDSYRNIKESETEDHRCQVKFWYCDYWSFSTEKSFGKGRLWEELWKLESAAQALCSFLWQLNSNHLKLVFCICNLGDLHSLKLKDSLLLSNSPNLIHL